MFETAARMLAIGAKISETARIPLDRVVDRVGVTRLGFGAVRAEGILLAFEVDPVGATLQDHAADLDRVSIA